MKDCGDLPMISDIQLGYLDLLLGKSDGAFTTGPRMHGFEQYKTAKIRVP